MYVCIYLYPYLFDSNAILHDYLFRFFLSCVHSSFLCYRAAWPNWLLNSWILTQGHPSGWTALKSKHEHTNKGSHVCNVIKLYSSIQCVWLAICWSIHVLFGRLVPKRYKGKQTLITDQFPEEGRQNRRKKRGERRQRKFFSSSNPVRAPGEEIYCRGSVIYWEDCRGWIIKSDAVLSIRHEPSCSHGPWQACPKSAPPTPPPSTHSYTPPLHTTPTTNNLFKAAPLCSKLTVASRWFKLPLTTLN